MGAKGDGAIDLDRLAEPGRGRAVLTASNAREYSFESPGDLEPTVDSPAVGSVFTAALLAGLRDGSADLDGDGFITVDEAYAYAFRQVRASGAAQTPQRWLSGGEGQLLLARNPAGGRRAPTLLPHFLRTALASSVPEVQIGAVEELGHWLTSADLVRVVTAKRELERLAECDIPSVEAAARAALRHIAGGTTLPAPEQQTASAARRDLLLAVQHLYNWAGKPGTRTIGDWLEERAGRPDSGNPEVVEGLLRGDISQWEDLASVVEALATHQVVGTSNVASVLAQIRELWVAVDTDVPANPSKSSDPKPMPEPRRLDSRPTRTAAPTTTTPTSREPDASVDAMVAARRTAVSTLVEPIRRAAFLFAALHYARLSDVETQRGRLAPAEVEPKRPIRYLDDSVKPARDPAWRPSPSLDLEDVARRFAAKHNLDSAAHDFGVGGLTDRAMSASGRSSSSGIDSTSREDNRRPVASLLIPPSRPQPRVETVAQRRVRTGRVKERLLKEALQIAKRRASYNGIAADLRQYLIWYYRSATADHLSSWNSDAFLGAAESHYRLAARRPKRGMKARVFTPTTSQHGWNLNGLSVIEIVCRYTDANPEALYERLGVRPHLVLSVDFAVQRSGKMFGELEVLFGHESDAAQESWWHIGVDAVSEPRSLERAVAAQMLSILRTGWWVGGSGPNLDLQPGVEGQSAPVQPLARRQQTEHLARHIAALRNQIGPGLFIHAIGICHFHASSTPS